MARTTKRIGVREVVEQGFPRAVEAAQRHNLLITKHGRPVAVLIGVATEPGDAEAIQLAAQAAAEMLAAEEG